ncbi:MAG TPA: carbohydrate porin [Candidatus Omnitrophota bacterium]|nr:carbohydrate porin [Candidatus Omnitrophota bacterium]HOX09094.1 carbohydrate porin [Candidatus Omnitrophota bacterium]
MRNALLVLASLVAFGAAGVSYASDSGMMHIIESEDYLTGGWGGMREKLEEAGVDFKSSYTADVLGNPSGGKSHGVRYNHSLGAELNFDLEKLANLDGLMFRVSGLYRAGRNLSEDYIGNRFVVSSIYGCQQLRLYALNLEQSMFDGRVALKIGRTSAGDDFASSPLYWIYVNNAIDGNPISLPIDLPFSTYPNAVWGARLKAKPFERVVSMTGVYDANVAQVGSRQYHGTYFDLRFKKGVFVIQEFQYLNNGAKGDTGMPGNYKIGGYYDTGKFTSLEDSSQRRGNYGGYVAADQMVYREGGPGTDQGLTALGAITFAPSEYNEFPFFIDGGVFYKGLIHGRDKDIAALGFAYGNWSDDFPGDLSHEAMIDLSYKIQINGWMYLQPDLQYIFRPGGSGDIDNALVLGTRLGITF